MILYAFLIESMIRGYHEYKLICCCSKGLAISSETLLLAASIDDDGTRSLSGPLGSGKANPLSF